MIRFSVMICLLLSTSLIAAGCGADERTAGNQAPATSSTESHGGIDSGPGSLIETNTLMAIDKRLQEATSLAARFTYVSTSGIDDNPRKATGTVFVPKGNPPQEGWPMIAFGHPQTGIHPECAPSSSPTLLDSATAIASLVSAGYVVTVPDYQGLGLNETYHPFLDSTTVGYNLIDSVRAARTVVPNTSDRWVALGVAQGGQAAWAANELVEDYGGGLQFLGAVSVSPIADINGLADAAAAGELTKDQQLALVAYLASLKNEFTEFDLDAYRRGIVRENWDLLLSCRGPDADQRVKVADQISADDLRPSPEAVEMLHGYLRKTTLPQAPTIAPMLVIYGDQDPLIPKAWTDRALYRACKMGDVIQIEQQPDIRGTDIDLPAAMGWIKARFNSEPAANECEAFTATHESLGEGR
jgi:pimeloyl-ACP methyl ester carboxylesterase